MFIKKMSNEVYKKFLNYALKQCDAIILYKYHNQHPTETQRKLNVILSEPQFSKTRLVNDYSDELLDEAYNYFKDDVRIFDKDYIDNYETPKEEYSDIVRMHAIRDTVCSCVYEVYTDNFLKKYKKNIICTKRIRFLNSSKLYQTIYMFENVQEIRDEIYNRAFDYWVFPNCLEDLSFTKDKYFWYRTITHEDDYNIYCENEEEYEYLKSIGVEFYEDHFVKEDKTFWTVS